MCDNPLELQVEIAMHNGYVKLWRKVRDCGIIGHPNAVSLFFYAMITATSKPRKVVVKGTVLELGEGELIIAVRETSRLLGMTEQNLRTALAMLEKLEILTRRPTHHCTIIKLVKWHVYQAKESQGNTPDNTDPTQTQHRLNTDLTREQEVKKLRSEEFKKKPKPLLPEADASFETFWKAYPKKVGKGAAMKAWKKTKDVPLPDILLAIEAQKSSDQWTRDGGQFIPYPATWLNQGRWADEIDTTPRLRAVTSMFDD